MEQAPKKRARRDDYAVRTNAQAKIRLDPHHPLFFDEDPYYPTLLDVQPTMTFEKRFHPKLIGLLVALHPGCADTRTLRAVQHSELNPGRIGIDPHGAAESIDFAHDVTLCQSTNGRITGHLADCVQVLTKQQRLGAKAGRRQGRLNSGVAGTHHNDIVFLGEKKMFHVESSIGAKTHERRRQER